MKLGSTFLAAGLVLSNLLGGVCGLFTGNWGYKVYNTEPVETETGIYQAGPFEYKASEETKEQGYIEARFNDDYSDSDDKYIIWVNDPEQDCQVYQYTLNEFEDWTMMPMPYEDQYIVIFKMTADDYAKSFTKSRTINNWKLGFRYMRNRYVVPVETVCCFEMNDMGNYLDNLDCFNQETVWINWDENSAMIQKANELRSENPDDYDFANAVFDYITNNIEYDYEKLGHRAGDKYYGHVVHEDNFNSGKGVCSDKSGIFCAMLRSQGIACRYEEGFAPSNKYEDHRLVGHAWNRVYRDGVMDGYDTTVGLTYIPQEYQLDQVK